MIRHHFACLELLENPLLEEGRGNASINLAWSLRQIFRTPFTCQINFFISEIWSTNYSPKKSSSFNNSREISGYKLLFPAWLCSLPYCNYNNKVHLWLKYRNLETLTRNFTDLNSIEKLLSITLYDLDKTNYFGRNNENK